LKRWGSRREREAGELGRFGDAGVAYYGGRQTFAQGAHRLVLSLFTKTMKFYDALPPTPWASAPPAPTLPMGISHEHSVRKVRKHHEFNGIHPLRRDTKVVTGGESVVKDCGIDLDGAREVLDMRSLT
jgi:hypothetical protein